LTNIPSLKTARDFINYSDIIAKTANRPLLEASGDATEEAALVRELGSVLASLVMSGGMSYSRLRSVKSHDL
jgi:hypothetical protein